MDRWFSLILDGFQSLMEPIPLRNVNIWLVFEVFPYPRQVPTHETTTPGSCRARLAGASGGGLDRCFSSILDGFRSLPEPIPHRNVNIWPVFEVFPHPRQVPTHEKTLWQGSGGVWWGLVVAPSHHQFRRIWPVCLTTNPPIYREWSKSHCEESCQPENSLGSRSVQIFSSQLECKSFSR